MTPYYDMETDRQRAKRLEEGINNCPSRILIQKTGKIVGIRYTPDFYFKYNNLNVYIEAKGIENDVFYIKKKMFLHYLDQLYTEKGEKSMYFEVYTKKQLLQAIEIIKIMSSTPTERIKKLISLLPEKDVDLGYKFLDSRDFSSLKELVDSAILKVKKNMTRVNPRPEYAKIDLEGLYILKSEVDVYLMRLEPPNDFNNLDYEVFIRYFMESK